VETANTIAGPVAAGSQADKEAVVGNLVVVESVTVDQDGRRVPALRIWDYFGTGTWYHRGSSSVRRTNASDPPRRDHGSSQLHQTSPYERFLFGRACSAPGEQHQ
jgi:hypothetical protein